MKLPFLSKNDSGEYLLALLLRQEKTAAVVIKQSGGESTIIGRHEEFFETSLEETSEEEWLKILDATITQAEEKLPDGIETKKTIFGVPAHWVEEKHIKKEYLQKLKKTSDELSLEPIGFLEIPEAIAHLLLEEEGVPVSAVLLELGRKFLALSLIRGGKVVETKAGAVGHSSVETVDEMLKSFGSTDPYPSRIIVFNGGHDEALIQSFIAHHWSRSIPFLHMPQISLLPQGFDGKAVVFGASKQLGFDIISALDLKATDIKTFSAKDTKHPEKIAEELHEQEEKVERETVTKDDDAEAFGFVKDEDIALNEPVKKQGEEQEEPKPLHNAQRKNPSLTDENLKEPAFAIHSPHDTQTAIPRTAIPEQEQTKTQLAGGSILSKLSAIPASLSSLLPRSSGGMRKKALIILPFLLVAIIALVLAYLTLVRATVSVEIVPEDVAQEENIVFSAGGNNDFEDNVIAAKTVSVSIKGETSLNTTGKEEIGEKAKGTVTIFNSASSKQDIKAGEEVASSNDLSFVLDKDVSVASASGDIFSGTKPGTADVEVTAVAIGSEYNLPSNTKFTVSSNSQLAARNEKAFSGGSKKQVTVVDEEDIANITKILPQKLEEQAKEEIAKKLTSRETLLTIVPNFKPSQNDFSAGAGDEASTLTLASSVTFEGIAYSNDDLVEYATALLSEESDDDMTVSEKDLENSLKNIDTEADGGITAVLSMKARLIPVIDEEKIKKDFAGKSFDDVTKALREYPQVDRVTISHFPPLPFLPKVLPRQESNIAIDIKTRQ